MISLINISSPLKSVGIHTFKDNLALVPVNIVKLEHLPQSVFCWGDLHSVDRGGVGIKVRFGTLGVGYCLVLSDSNWG